MFKITKQTVHEVVGIIILSVLLGLGLNLIHPKKVAISYTRPPIQTAPDSVFAMDLPQVKINDNTAAPAVNPSEPVIIATEQVIKLIKEQKTILIDSREPEIYAEEHLPGAINLPIEFFNDYISQAKSLPQDNWLICYCDGPNCDKSETLAYQLMNYGFKRVAIYIDGLEGWKNANQKTEGQADAK